jgi:hypothetical protein
VKLWLRRERARAQGGVGRKWHDKGGRVAPHRDNCWTGARPRDSSVYNRLACALSAAQWRASPAGTRSHCLSTSQPSWRAPSPQTQTQLRAVCLLLAY